MYKNRDIDYIIGKIDECWEMRQELETKQAQYELGNHLFNWQLK